MVKVKSNSLYHRPKRSSNKIQIFQTMFEFEKKNEFNIPRPKMIREKMHQLVVASYVRLCDDIDAANYNDIANLYANLAGNFENVVQYNRDNRAFEVHLPTCFFLLVNF